MKKLVHFVNRFVMLRWIRKYSTSVNKILPNFIQLYHSKDVIVNLKCTELEVNTNRLTSFIIKDLLPLVGLSPYPITEQLLLCSAVVKIKPDYIFEWGTHMGISARIFYEVCRKYELNTIIHSIDLPDDVDHIEHPGHMRGIKVHGLQNVKLHQGDGLDTSIRIAKNLNTKSSFLFLLDGDHSYESVTRELNGINKSFPKANMLIHDTFYQSSESRYNIGPFEAVRDFLENNPNHYKKISIDLGLPGMTLLYT